MEGVKFVDIDIYKDNRNYSLDVIRIFALIFVISVHFFLNTGYYEIPQDSWEMALITIYRSFFLICVPLFILLTGYLNKNKKVSKQYYIKISKYIWIYLLATILIGIYQRFCLIDQTLTLRSFAKKTMSFSVSGNAWYVEMYLGLYLMIPFLNKIWNGCKPNEKRILILVFAIITFLPNTINNFRLLPLEWWKMPSSNLNYIEILPNYWMVIYPITYYFLGSYISEINLDNVKLKKYVIIEIIITILFGLYNYYRSYPQYFVSGGWQEYNSILVAIIAVLFFIILLKIDFNNIAPNSKKIIKFISDRVYGAYLCSWILDNFIYKYLNLAIPVVLDRLSFFLFAILINFISSIILSEVVQILYKIIDGINKRLWRKRNEEKI